MEVGRVCVKLTGREAGRKAVIVEAGKDSLVIEGPHVRKRKVTPRHVLLTNDTAKVSEFAFKGKVGKPAKEGKKAANPKGAKK